MKRLCGISITVASVLLLGMAAQGQCSNATLSGNYSFTVAGQILGIGPGAGPVNGVAETHFNGAGHLSQVDFVVHNGVVPLGWRPATGTYTVNADCTGSAVITPVVGPALNLEFVVLRSGKEIRTVVANPNFQINSIGVRSSDEDED